MLGDSFCKFNNVSAVVFANELSIPMLGDSFCKTHVINEAIHKLELSIPMLGDSFCKRGRQPTLRRHGLGFQSPCLGTLFARKWCNWVIQEIQDFQSPCLGTLFARGFREELEKRGVEILSIPMLGDSFCKNTLNNLRSPYPKYFQSPCLGTLFASWEGREDG